MNSGMVAAAHAAGLKVNAWTPNRAAYIVACLALGVDGIITDRPELLANVAARP
ncbi:MAG: hypothetical protein IMX01_10565 [Limnochordaceae bacterium]|nr:hypothetical protein [Limnochordaceae bacterium]